MDVAPRTIRMMELDRCVVNASRRSRKSGLAVWALLSAFIAASLSAFIAASLHAHHSFPGVYDPDRMLTVRGKVVEVHYINPHIHIVIDQIADDGTLLRDARGNPLQWTGETMSVRVAQRRNFTRRSLQVGQVISLRGWASRKEGVRELGVSAIIQESGHLVWARQNIRGGRKAPPAPYPGLVPRSSDAE